MSELLHLLLLDKGKALTLDMVSTELISVHDHNEHDLVVEETEKKAKAEQLALFAKTTGSSGNSAKKNKKGKLVDKSKKPKVQPPRTQYNTYGQEGHWSPEYPNKSTKEKNGVPQSSRSANVAVNALQSLGERKVGTMLMVTTEGTKVTGILLDCAVSCHMFMDQNYFISYHESTSEFITVGGQNHISVIGHSSIKFQAVLLHGYINLTIHNVLHTPQLGANLVSLGILHC